MVYLEEEVYDRPSLTTDNASNIAATAEKDCLFDWNRCICHCLHLAVTDGLKSSIIIEAINDLSMVATKMKRSTIEWRRF